MTDRTDCCGHFCCRVGMTPLFRKLGPDASPLNIFSPPPMQPTCKCFIATPKQNYSSSIISLRTHTVNCVITIQFVKKTRGPADISISQLVLVIWRPCNRHFQNGRLIHNECNRMGGMLVGGSPAIYEIVLTEFEYSSVTCMLVWAKLSQTLEFVEFPITDWYSGRQW